MENEVKKQQKPQTEYIVQDLVCPQCTTYLSHKPIGAIEYKYCNSCGYARVDKYVKHVLVVVKNDE